MGTDRDWERWGANDPYFGVISNEAYRSGAMSADSRAQFFASGKAHVAGTLAALRDLFGVEVAPCSVLDFGCGVGRLVIPFARASGHVTGMDISPSMLAETRANCAAEGLSNVSLLQSTGDRLPELHASYDLIHSDIVLPHIAWARGRTIIGALARHVTPGGFLALQIAHCMHGTARNASAGQAALRVPTRQLATQPDAVTAHARAGHAIACL